MTTEERIEKLEKRQKFLIVSLLALLSAGAITLIMGMDIADTAKTKFHAELITANQFRIVDSNGNSFGGMSVGPNGGANLLLCDKNGIMRISVNLAPDEPDLIIYDKNIKPQISISAKETGPLLSLRDKNSEPRVILNVAENGPALLLKGKNGDAVLNVWQDGPTLGLRDAAGITRAMLIAARNGSSSLFLFDENANSVAELVADKDTRGLGLRDEKGERGVSLTLFKDGSGIAKFGANKETIWQAPTNR
jgi:hypothetical protein